MHLMTLNQKKKQCNLFYLPLPSHDETYMSDVTPQKRGKYETNGGKFEISNMSQHHQVRYQITPLVTLNQKTHTECNLLHLLLPLHKKHVPRSTHF